MTSRVGIPRHLLTGRNMSVYRQNRYNGLANAFNVYGNHYSRHNGCYLGTIVFLGRGRWYVDGCDEHDLLWRLRTGSLTSALDTMERILNGTEPQQPRCAWFVEATQGKETQS